MSDALSEKLYTVPEVATFLRGTRWLVYSLVKKKKLRPVRIGHRVLFRGATIRAFLDAAERDKPASPPATRPAASVAP